MESFPSQRLWKTQGGIQTGSHINHLDNSICYTTRWAWSRSDGSCLAAWYRGHQASFGKRSSTASLCLRLYCWQCQQELKYHPKILVRQLLITDLLKARTTVDSIKWLFCENTRNKPAVAARSGVAGTGRMLLYLCLTCQKFGSRGWQKVLCLQQSHIA